jgi:uncharacterized membrane protein YeaQ/YmgE (transglycosylase-associated protein family)
VSINAWIALGLLAGMIAKAVMYGEEPAGIVVTAHAVTGKRLA